MADPGGECGRAVAANPLVVGGRPLQRGQWPWLAAVFILKSLGLEFHCSGTIITRKFVLTGKYLRTINPVTSNSSHRMTIY